MKVWSAFGMIGGVTLVGSGVLLAIGNPGTPDYEDYALETLSTYLKTEICPKAPSEIITGKLRSP